MLKLFLERLLLIVIGEIIGVVATYIVVKKER